MSPIKSKLAAGLIGAAVIGAAMAASPAMAKGGHGFHRHGFGHHGFGWSRGPSYYGGYAPAYYGGYGYYGGCYLKPFSDFYGSVFYRKVCY
jgi:hypothetical protein